MTSKSPLTHDDPDALNASVAQWTRHLITDQAIGGSSPSRRANRRPRWAVYAFLAVLVAGCDPDAATTVTAALNATRAAHGQPQLVRVAQLDAKAVAQAQIMADNGTISHSTDAALVWGLRSGWTQVGENVAEVGAVDRCQPALEGSPPHLANMLTRTYTQVGIGVVQAGGRVFCVQVFVAR